MHDSHSISLNDSQELFLGFHKFQAAVWVDLVVTKNNNINGMSHLKAYCLYHSDQGITNFCKDKNCLMPLCPTCIREHTHYHQDLKTKPLYFSIQETVNQVREQVYATIAQLEQDNAKRAEILQRMNNWNAFVGQTVSKTKEMVHAWVQEEFAQLQDDIFKYFHQKHEELGVFSLAKTEKIEDELSKTATELYDLYDSLKTDKFLGSIIVFLEDTQTRAQALHSKFATFQQVNDGYSPRIEINKGFKRTLTSCFAKMFRLEAIHERENKGERGEERSRSPRFLGKSKVGGDEKWEKLERSYTPERSTAYLRHGSESSRTGFVHGNVGFSNKIYKEESPQRIYAFSPSSKPDPLSLPAQPRRSVYRDDR